MSFDIISIYTEYKSNYTEANTTTIGIPVSTLDEIPKGLIGRELYPNNFQKFVTKGEIPQAVVDVWLDIMNRDHELN